MALFDIFYCSPASGKKLEQHRHRLYRIAYSWTRQPALADDLVQETLTKALQKRGQLREPSSGEAWLYRILANCYRDHFRRTRATDEFDDNQLIEELTPEIETGELEIVARVRAAIARLPEGQRQVVTLVDIEGFSYVEVAHILEVPIGTVMSRLCRARGGLKQILTRALQTGQNLPQTPAGAGATRMRRIK